MVHRIVTMLDAGFNCFLSDFRFCRGIDVFHEFAELLESVFFIWFDFGTRCYVVLAGV